MAAQTIEVMEEDIVLLEPVRSLAMDRLFPDQRDLGIQWHRQKADGHALDLAVVNGQGINAADAYHRLPRRPNPAA